MAIKSSEYISILTACHEIIHQIRDHVNAEFFYENLDMLRKQYKIIFTEWDCYTLYPRHKTEKLKEAMELMKSFCSQTDVTIQWGIPTNVELDEHSWSTYREVDPIARFYFNQVEITKLLDVK